MEFTSFYFLTFFLPLTMVARYCIPAQYRNVTILLLSYLFYAWGNPYNLAVLLALTAVNYFCAFRSAGQLTAIAINIATLCSFKYIPELSFPLGLSFYTFQLIAYQMDVRRGNMEVEKNMPAFMLYVSFFPKMVTGPIARYQTFPEDYRNTAFDLNNFTAGLERFSLGLSKKVFIADAAARIADCVFGAPADTIPTAYCWLGAFAYMIQIFFDFSGCTDMAIGIGQMLGFRLPENFDYPYSAKSIQEFWRRWHISLSSWFRDYLYIPLGGNRKGKLREYLNMFIVFLLCGAWHGATWTFVLWGAYHGAWITFEKMGWKKILKKLPAPVSNIYLLLIVLIGWVLFRADNIDNALTMLNSMFLGNAQYPYQTFIAFYHILDLKGPLMLILGMVLSYPIAAKIYQKAFCGKYRLARIFLMFLFAYLTAITSGISPSIYGKF